MDDTTARTALHHHDVFDTRCPTCSRLNPLHSSVSGKSINPSNGDVSLCYGCHTPAIYQLQPFGQLRLRACTDDELAELLADPDIADAIAAMRTTGHVDGAIAQFRVRERRRTNGGR